MSAIPIAEKHLRSFWKRAHAYYTDTYGLPTLRKVAKVHTKAKEG